MEAHRKQCLALGGRSCSPSAARICGVVCQALYTAQYSAPERERASRKRGTPGGATEKRDSSKGRGRIFFIGGEAWPNLGLGLER